MKKRNFVNSWRRVDEKKRIFVHSWRRVDEKKDFLLTLGMRNAGLSVWHFLACNWASGAPIRRRGYRWTLVTPPATTRPSSSGRPPLPSSSLLHTHAGK